MPGPTKVAPAKYANELSEKDRIFNVAVKFLEKVGYEKLSIRKICVEADISVGKFYTYFKNKQELLSHFYNIALKDFDQKLKSEDFNPNNYDFDPITGEIFTDDEISIDLCMIVKGIIFTWVAERGRFDLPAVTRDMYKRALVGILPA